MTSAKYGTSNHHPISLRLDLLTPSSFLAILDVMATYPGGKAGAGTYQKIINLIPPHSVYVEPFVGGAAIYRAKAPAEKSILIDLVPSALQAIPISRGLHIICDDGIQWLRDNLPMLPADTFIYCDPPYVISTRKSGPRYEYEMADTQHEDLLAILAEASCRIMISGYWSSLYASRLAASQWRHTTFMAMTRGGTMAEEHLWMNYDPPVKLHDHKYAGKDFRERERIKRKVQRWTRKLQGMGHLELSSLLSAIAAAEASLVSKGDTSENDEWCRSLAMASGNDVRFS